ncbi:hypothetical protein Tco_0922062 [Tanacetum coccineum]|uniref:Uncharacterized protein n=1 Tax=Tanacetum coccineum TaxID=301880 RepID=A0ABQ5CY35_9ASTR
MHMSKDKVSSTGCEETSGNQSLLPIIESCGPTGIPEMSHIQFCLLTSKLLPAASEWIPLKGLPIIFTNRVEASILDKMFMIEAEWRSIHKDRQEQRIGYEPKLDRYQASQGYVRVLDLEYREPIAHHLIECDVIVSMICQCKATASISATKENKGLRISALSEHLQQECDSVVQQRHSAEGVSAGTVFSWVMPTLS